MVSHKCAVFIEPPCTDNDGVLDDMFLASRILQDIFKVLGLAHGLALKGTRIFQGHASVKGVPML